MPHIIPLLSQKRGIRSGCYNANKTVYKLRVQSQLILCPCPILLPSLYKREEYGQAATMQTKQCINWQFKANRSSAYAPHYPPPITKKRNKVRLLQCKQSSVQIESSNSTDALNMPHIIPLLLQKKRNKVRLLQCKQNSVQIESSESTDPLNMTTVSMLLGRLCSVVCRRVLS